MIINGISVDSKDVLGQAENAANLLSRHSLEIAIESYYLDHQFYPTAKNYQELISLLKKEKYIKGGPDDESVFYYQSSRGGQEYRLDLTKKNRS